MNVDLEMLEKMTEKVNAVFIRGFEKPYSVNDAEQTKREIAVLCELMAAFEEFNNTLESLTTAEYEKIKERIYNAMLGMVAVFNPPTIEEINMVRGKL
jgi:transcriptional regulator of NAD metabolism